MVAAISKYTEKLDDVLQQRDIQVLSAIKSLCQHRHGCHHFLDNSVLRLQHFNRRWLTHLISLTIMTEWRLPDIHSALVLTG
jgi:hypothetical protein